MNMRTIPAVAIRTFRCIPALILASATLTACDGGLGLGDGNKVERVEIRNSDFTEISSDQVIEIYADLCTGINLTAVATFTDGTPVTITQDAEWLLVSGNALDPSFQDNDSKGILLAANGLSAGSTATAQITLNYLGLPATNEDGSPQIVNVVIADAGIDVERSVLSPVDSVLLPGSAQTFDAQLITTDGQVFELSNLNSSLLSVDDGDPDNDPNTNQAEINGDRPVGVTIANDAEPGEVTITASLCDGEPRNGGPDVFTSTVAIASLGDLALETSIRTTNDVPNSPENTIAKNSLVALEVVGIIGEGSAARSRNLTSAATYTYCTEALEQATCEAVENSTNELGFLSSNFFNALNEAGNVRIRASYVVDINNDGDTTDTNETTFDDIVIAVQNSEFNQSSELQLQPITPELTGNILRLPPGGAAAFQLIGNEASPALRQDLSAAFTTITAGDSTVAEPVNTVISFFQFAENRTIRALEYGEDESATQIKTTTLTTTYLDVTSDPITLRVIPSSIDTATANSGLSIVVPTAYDALNKQYQFRSLANYVPDTGVSASPFQLEVTNATVWTVDNLNKARISNSNLEGNGRLTLVDECGGGVAIVTATLNDPNGDGDNSDQQRATAVVPTPPNCL